MSADCETGPIACQYDRGELIADGVVHVAGLSLSLIGAIALLIIAARSSNALLAPAVAIYSVGLLSMFGFSAAYNMWPISRTKWVLRRYDHSAIFVMIAGTYTAFLTQMAANTAFLGHLICIWLIAIVGVAVKIYFPGRFERASLVVYLLLGWSGMLSYEAWKVLPNASQWLLAVGGVLYSAGTVFHGWHSLRFQNAIWHVFVLVATGCHYSAIFYCFEKSAV